MYTYTAAITEEGTCYIGNRAFAHHRDLKFLVLPEGVKSITIGRFAFSGCNIESLVFPEGLKNITIGYGAFHGCKRLKSLVFHEGVENITIGDLAFCRCNIESLGFPEGVESITIGNYAFRLLRWCHNLKSLVFPASVKSITIGCKAFADCNIESLYFPPGVESITIGNGAFYGCNIESLVFPEGLKNITIGNEAFRSCRNLKSLGFPEVVESITIGNGAFYGCNLESLVFHEIDIKTLNDILFLVPEDASTSNKRDYVLNTINLALVQIASDTLDTENKKELLYKLQECVESKRNSDRNPILGAYFNLQLDFLKRTIGERLKSIQDGEEECGDVELQVINRFETKEGKGDSEPEPVETSTVVSVGIFEERDENENSGLVGIFEELDENENSGLERRDSCEGYDHEGDEEVKGEGRWLA